MPTTLPEKVVEHIGVTSAALAKAAAAMDAQAAEKTARDALIPAAVDALVANERIAPEEREKAAQVLADPVKTLQLLTKVAAHRNTAESARLGSPTNPQAEKTARARQPNTDAPRTGLRESDRRLFTGLGLTPPEE